MYITSTEVKSESSQLQLVDSLICPVIQLYRSNPKITKTRPENLNIVPAIHSIFRLDL